MDELRRVIGARLIEARKVSGLSQLQAAQLLGIDRPRLSGMENGERPVDVTMLVQLAQIYDVSTADIVGSVDQKASTHSVRLRAALAERLEDRVLREELKGFLTFIERYTRLRRVAGLRPRRPQLFYREQIHERPKFAAEGDAQALRNHWGLDDAPIGLGIFDLLEERGIDVYREPLTETRIAGAFLDVPDVGPFVFVNARDWPYRQVFTVAHELAHLIYHRGNRISYKQDNSAGETLANSFASAFLMPEGAIKRYLAARDVGVSGVYAEDVIALHRHFGVSYGAMLVRLRRLQILQHQQYEVLKEERPVHLALTLAYRVEPWEFRYDPCLNAAATRLSWLPRTYVRLIRKASERGELTQHQAASYLNLDYESWNALHKDVDLDAKVSQEDLEDAEFAVR